MGFRSTDLSANLGALYSNYGGIRAFVRSEYTFIAMVVGAFCWQAAVTGAWSSLATSILPTLAGFSIAAYAIFFAVLDERAKRALSAPAEELNNRSPLLILASSICHAVVVQVLALLSGIVYTYTDIKLPSCLAEYAWYVKITFSAFGLFLTIYGVVLILASILSIFKILEITTRIQK